MDQRQRTTRIRSRWSYTLLLGALLAYGGCIVTVATGAGFALFCLSAAVVVAGVIVAVRAVAAGSRVVERHQQTVLLWSLWSLAFLSTAVLILLGSYGIFATPACRVGCPPSIAYAGLVLLLTSLLGAASVIAGIGAGVAGVSSAAVSGKWGWFTAVLAYLLGSWLSAVLVYVLVGRRVISVDSPSVVVFVSPLLTPVLTLLYSLSGREQRVRT